MIQETQRYYRPSNNYNKKPATFVTDLVARMGLEPVCAIGAYEDFLRK
jgi:hypothetical protein